MTAFYVPPAPAVPKTQVLRHFLEAIGWDTAQESGYPLFPGPEIPSAPDREVTLTPSGGPGYVTEEAALDAWSFQARLRGPANDPDAAELAAQQLDYLILAAPVPQKVDGVTVSAVSRLGSPPAPLPLDPADRRTEYTTTYVITTGGA